ncbi:hypothetical protein [Crocosphaera sp.]|uniref:hypothetical protein n=1 Tax=Crocosphaera sp. TaxID=2729996 RepID=UPI003F298F93|nr:hypothetical protein [Crocosphaera sp.]
MRNTYGYYWYFSFSFGLGFFVLVAFFLLQWLDIPAGNFIDWAIGVASFWWLLAIVTVPWNIYFEAKEVAAEAAMSQDQGIAVDSQQLTYVKTVSRGALLGAIALHLFSALGLYELAVTGISSVGYISSFATLLLTALRPAVRGYQYVAYRLSTIRQQIKYPRQDILELRNRFSQLEQTVNAIHNKLNTNNPNSWINKQQKNWEITGQEVIKIGVQLDKLEAKNTIEHEEISREARKAISQLTEDSNFLHQVREIIRFVKTA